MMANSGARGNQDQMRQLAGMRGLMAKPSGEIIETPITSSFREGLTILQYFTSTHGARKGLADTALKTANSGYLTRRLVDVVQDVIVSEHDCKTVDGIELTHVTKSGEITVRLSERVLGRTAMYDILDPETPARYSFPSNAMITEELCRGNRASRHSTITIRSALTCKAKHGVCALCYGRDSGAGSSGQCRRSRGHYCRPVHR
jgi:DNA-directed RNA polymerase subunit beta'